MRADVQEPRRDRATTPADGDPAAARRPTVKLTVNLPESEMELIRARALENQETVTQLLRRAIGTTLFLDEEVAQGGRVLVERSDGRLVEVVFPGMQLAAHARQGLRQVGQRLRTRTRRG